MAAGDTLGLTLPTVGATAWGGTLNTVLSSIITSIEANVPVGNLNVNTDLDFNQKNITNLGYTKYTAQAATLTSGYERSLWFYNGELYVTDGSGNAVPMTSDGALSSLASNGIEDTSGGGYGGGGTVFLEWNGTQYDFHDGSNDYAIVRMDNCLLEDGAGSFVTLDVPTLTTDYTWTFATALPSTDSLVQITSAGVLQYSNTVANAVTLTGGIDTGLTINSGDLTLTSGSIIAASGDLTCDDITADLYIDAVNQELTIPSTKAFGNDGGTGTWYHATDGKARYSTSSSDTGYSFIPLDLPVGTTIVSVTAYYQTTSTGSTNDMALERVNTSGTVTTVLSSGATASTGGNETLSISPSHTTLTGQGYYLAMTHAHGATANDSIMHNFKITYKRVS